MPWETVITNSHGDTAQQFRMPAGWQADYARYVDGLRWTCPQCGRPNEAVIVCPICKERKPV